MLALLLAALTQPFAPPQSWPTVRNRAVLVSPDWSNYEIYPAAARDNDEEGQVIVSVRIDRAGTPTECALVKASASLALNDGTCALAMTMRFQPVRDERGNAIESYWNGNIFWLLADARPFTSSQVTASLLIAGGKVARCDTTGWGVHAALWQQSACLNLHDTDWLLGAARERASGVAVTLTLDTGDGLVRQHAASPPGRLVGEQLIRFDVNHKGDADHCVIMHEVGLGKRSFATQHPCERFLSKLWFEEPATKGMRQAGTFAMRVYAIN